MAFGQRERIAVGVLLVLVLALGVAAWLASAEGVETASTVASNGLMLSASINATQISLGQSLHIDVSLFNTFQRTDSVATADDWLFHGVPVALWPACYFTDSNTPAQAVILKGDYSLTDLKTMASVSFRIVCEESAQIDHAIFQPSSSRANLTGTGFFPPSGTDGPYQLSINYTTYGYWNLSNESQQYPTNVRVIGEPQPSPGCSDCSPLVPATIPFVPGVYTIAIADEWGQAVILHFHVKA